MNDENWKAEFKQWKQGLKPLHIKLLEDGPQNQNQACILNEMWCEWKEIAVKRKLNQIAKTAAIVIEDPWAEGSPETSDPYS